MLHVTKNATKAELPEAAEKFLNGGCALPRTRDAAFPARRSCSETGIRGIRM